jgi:hypothetical protein
MKNALIAAALVRFILTQAAGTIREKLRFFEIALVLVRLDHVPASAASKPDNFRFQFGLGFTFCDERLDRFVDDIGHPHTFSLCCPAKGSQRCLVKAIERPAAFKNKGRNIARSLFWSGFHATV